ncbi:MAG: hypothetical protein Q7L55_06115 [Actinomycetota bacterium]|nr:hypothetical protein [Actinomycetota bacterium]
MMFSMFLLWMAAFLAIILRWKWTIALVLVCLVWTAVILKSHISDPIPLNF